LRVLLAGQKSLFLEGLQNLLNSYGIEVAGTLTRIDDIINQIRRLQPDVIMINIAGEYDLAVINQVKIINPSIQVVAFTDSQENRQAAQQSGASVFLLSNIRSDLLLATVGVTSHD